MVHTFGEICKISTAFQCHKWDVHRQVLCTPGSCLWHGGRDNQVDILESELLCFFEHPTLLRHRGMVQCVRVTAFQAPIRWLIDIANIILVTRVGTFELDESYMCS
jgi:hypothetical protein